MRNKKLKKLSTQIKFYDRFNIFENAVVIDAIETHKVSPTTFCFRRVIVKDPLNKIFEITENKIYMHPLSFRGAILGILFSKETTLEEILKWKQRFNICHYFSNVQ
jgi:hypothetical protein